MKRFVYLCLALTALVAAPSREMEGRRSPTMAPQSASQQALLNTYCITCHNERLKTGGLSLDKLDVQRRWRECRNLGKSGSQAAFRNDASERSAATGSRNARCFYGVPGDGAGSRGRVQAKSGTRALAAPESHRVRQRHSRSDRSWRSTPACSFRGTIPVTVLTTSPTS